MNLYIIRHGESTWNRLNKIQGDSDPPLSKLGRVQAGLLTKRFKKLKIDKIYSSPLARALQTAQILSRGLKNRIIRKEDLKEICLGEWEGRSPDEIDALYNNKYQRWLRMGPTRIKIPKAEGIGSFRKRAVKAFYEIIKDNGDKDVAVVTHGGVISAFLAHILEADFDKIILGLHLPNTCVTLVSFYKKRSCLVHIADTFHLPTKKVKDIWPA